MLINKKNLLHEEELEKVFIIENVKKLIIIEVEIYPYPLYFYINRKKKNRK